MLTVGGIVLMSVCELVRLKVPGLERVGVVPKLLEFGLVAIMKAVGLKLPVGGVVLMSDCELVRVRVPELEGVGAAPKLFEFELVVILKAVRLKLPVLLKRAVASRILAGQRSFQAPVTNCCLATQSSS